MGREPDEGADSGPTWVSSARAAAAAAAAGQAHMQAIGLLQSTGKC